MCIGLSEEMVLKRIQKKIFRTIYIWQKKQRKRKSDRLLEKKCSIYDFKLPLGPASGPDSEKMTHFDFRVHKEHMFLRNIFKIKISKVCLRSKIWTIITNLIKNLLEFLFYWTNFILKIAA